MKLSFLFVFVLCFLIVSITGFSQDDGEKIIEVSGMKYLLHTVKKSETTFSLCQKYKISQSELQKANPNLSAILETGAVVRIPKGKVVTESRIVEKDTQAKTPTDEEFYYHKVIKDQSLYSIARQYGVSESDLIRYNPESKNDLKLYFNVFYIFFFFSQQ